MRLPETTREGRQLGKIAEVAEEILSGRVRLF